MSLSSSKTPNIAVAQDLEAAFGMFIEASKALEEQQLVLQNQISQLSQELVEVNGRLSSLLNALPAGVILVENQVVIDFNPAATHLIPELNKGPFGAFQRLGRAQQQRVNTAKNKANLNKFCKFIKLIRVAAA